MPYINKEAREVLDSGAEPMNDGELNYKIYRMLLDYTYRQGLCYTTINEVIGVLSCVQQEYYRRMAAPYEDAKAKANGDIE